MVIKETRALIARAKESANAGPSGLFSCYQQNHKPKS
jgi:hypothetical protein